MNPLLLIVVLLSMITLLGPSGSPARAQESAPHQVGGFRLGTSVDQYELTSYRNFLKQVVVQNVHGFRKGIIYYGTCARPGEIVKIKLKYRDSSPGFYRELLKRYKKQFGKPDKFIGDAFGIVKAWEWNFRDSQGVRIRLKLQHNLKNPDESIGNTVKLEMPDRIQEERTCFNKQCAMRMKRGETCSGRPDTEQEWQKLIPR